MKKIISVVGARPNFIKIAPVHKAFLKIPEVEHFICHTGQHFDKKMSSIFFDELEMPKPDFYLGINGGSHAEQTAHIMLAFEKIVLKEKPDLVIVPGDVNSTLAASLVAAKLHIPLAHIEAGLRSFDKKMPEEINRILTDEVSDLLFVTEKSGLENLSNGGITKEKIFFTGNVMIDSLVFYLQKIKQSGILDWLKLKKNQYILVTFHRPSNVDHQENLTKIIESINRLAEQSKLIFPIHPRTRNNMEKFGLLNKLHKNIVLLDPVGYLDFLSLTMHAALVVTDSGGIQEETSFLGVQCVTVRNTTERPITCEIGTNHLVGQDYGKAVETSLGILAGKKKTGKIPELWDGKAAQRIVEVIVNYLNAKEA